MILHGDNCEDEYPGGADDSGIMSDMPIDYSSCNGACTLAIYWLGFQNEQWQAYTTASSASATTASVQASGSTANEASTETTEVTVTEISTTEAPATEAAAMEITGSSESITKASCYGRRRK
ncbi:hypothetical protein KRP22_013660 [Phytophthora ramorum]|nr:hypothetical protein KRP22_11162 [Phytophthora ramorum]